MAASLGYLLQVSDQVGRGWGQVVMPVNIGLDVEPVELPLTASIRGLLGIDEQTWPQTVNQFFPVVLAVSGGLSLPPMATVADAELTG